MLDHAVICIPTFRRPKMLARLLEAIARLETSARVSVVVADNDAENHAGLDLSRQMQAYRWPLTAVMAEKRGIAEARNVLIGEALKTNCGFIIMIDDDEWPEPGWIDAFLKGAAETGADVLSGSILFGQDGATGGHGDIRYPSGPIAMLQGAGNLLIRRGVLEEIDAPWFDPAFGLSGGEDREFFVRLERAGKRFAWVDEARAHGDVPETRASLGWRMRRAYSVGNSDMRVLLKYGPGPARMGLELAKILGSLLLSPLLAAILVASPNRRLLALQKLCRACGKLSAMAGRRYTEYAVVHGE